jgi:hypothetical protein
MSLSGPMKIVDQNAEALQTAVAWALELADRQVNSLAAALLAQVHAVVSVELPN